VTLNENTLCFPVVFCQRLSGKTASKIIGQGRAIKRLLSEVENVAGTGKEVLATAIPNLNTRGDQPMGARLPDDVAVQLFHGVVDSFADITNPRTVPMSHDGRPEGSPSWAFQGTIPCRSSGQHGYAVRVLPRHPDLGNPFEPGLLTWG